WKNAAEIKLLEGAKNGSTTARLCRDAANLYVAVSTKMTGPLPALPAGDESAHVVLLINANNDRNAYYHIAIFTNGRTRTQCREENPPWLDWTWKPKLDVKRGGTDAEWVYEIALPFAAFNKTRTIAREIGFNILCRDFASNETHSWPP